MVANGHQGSYWPIRRGVAQGCPLSPALFLIVAEGLSQMLNGGVTLPNGQRLQLQGIQVGSLPPFRVSQFADDTVPLLANLTSDLSTMWAILDIFQKGSGMLINKSKTEGLQLGRSASTACPSLFHSTRDTDGLSITHLTTTEVTLSLEDPTAAPLRIIPRLHPTQEEAASTIEAIGTARTKLPFRALLYLDGPRVPRGQDKVFFRNTTAEAALILRIR